MSTLSSASTLADVQAAYDDNASYMEDGSTAKAQAFVTACRFLVRLYKLSVSHVGGNQIGTDTKLFQDEARTAQIWLSRRGGVGAKHPSFEYLRE